jgi:hypothetical protein
MACPLEEGAGKVCQQEECAGVACPLEEAGAMLSGAAVSGTHAVAVFTDTTAEVSTDMIAEMTAEIAASGATALVRGLVRSGSAHNRGKNYLLKASAIAFL